MQIIQSVTEAIGHQVSITGVPWHTNGPWLARPLETFAHGNAKARSFSFD